MIIIIAAAFKCPARREGTPIMAVLPHNFISKIYQTRKWSRMYM